MMNKSAPGKMGLVLAGGGITGAVSGYKPEVIRKVLEARTQRCGKARRDKPICKLNRTLAELELALGAMDPTILQSM